MFQITRTKHSSLAFPNKLDSEELGINSASA